MSRKLQHRDTRHITLARSLAARLYVSVEGRVFAVSGTPAHDQLARCLARHDDCPTAAEAPTPRDLGLATTAGQLSPHLLHCIGRALLRWRKELAAEAARRPAQRRKSAELARERQEVEHLEQRLAAIRAWSAELAHGGEPKGAPLFLDPPDEERLQALLGAAESAAESAHALPPLIAWQVRVVYWLSGECAARRFVDAVLGLLAAYPQVSSVEQLRSFQKALLVLWKQRSAHEHPRQLKLELAQQIQRLSPPFARMFSARLRGRTFSEHCERLFQRCCKLLQTHQHHRLHAVPAALAALAAADGSTVALPRRCFQAGAGREDFAALLATIACLAGQLGAPGYDALLGAIDHLPRVPAEYEYNQLRLLLQAGNSVAEVAWVFEQDLGYSLGESCLSVPVARRLGAAFAARGWTLNAGELGRLVRQIQRPQQRKDVEAWLAWLGSVSPGSITPQLLLTLKATFWERILPSIQRPGWFESLSPALHPLKGRKRRRDVTLLLLRVAAYQHLLGKQQGALPKSVRKIIEFHERRARELAHLRARQAAAALDGAAQARLAVLESAARESMAIDTDKLRRAAEEVFVILGLEAQRAILQREAEAKCRQHLGELTTRLECAGLWEVAGWVEKMNDVQRQRLRTVIAAREVQGPTYKRYLAENQAWIAKAEQRGLDLEQWFAAESQVETIGGRDLEIVVAHELADVFRMGCYFGTCLSLGDINDLSVLTNALDANKQVVLMFARDDAGRRQVIGRQLLAISKDYRLLRYCCYLSWQHAEKAKRQAGLDAMAAYCGRLAAHCGLELANEGTPESLGGLFWYDDQAQEWPAAARAAWAAISGRGGENAADATLGESKSRECRNASTLASGVVPAKVACAIGVKVG